MERAVRLRDNRRIAILIKSMATAGVEVQVLLWAIGLLVTINTLLLGFLGSRLWSHVVECHGVGERVASMGNDVERMKRDIGTHDDGMRGEIHRTSSMVTQHELRITVLERK